MTLDEKYMKAAIREAKKAYKLEEYTYPLRKNTTSISKKIYWENK